VFLPSRVRGVVKKLRMIEMKKNSLCSLLSDPEMDQILAEAEEELKSLSPRKRKELFGTSYLPPDPQDISPVDWEDEDELPLFF
jgi:hypothetical protein